MQRTDDLTVTVMLDRVRVLEEALEALRAEAETDALTGLGNLRALERRTSTRGGWYVMADLDGFKRAQDGHPDGHAFGDVVLREFAEFLVGACRSRHGRELDRVCVRKGGDEFVVWCPTRVGARAIKERIRGWQSMYGPVSASAGMGPDVATADVNMYQDKRSGG